MSRPKRVLPFQEGCQLEKSLKGKWVFFHCKHTPRLQFAYGTLNWFMCCCSNLTNKEKLNKIKITIVSKSLQDPFPLATIETGPAKLWAQCTNEVVKRLPGDAFVCSRRPRGLRFLLLLHRDYIV